MKKDFRNLRGSTLMWWNIALQEPNYARGLFNLLHLRSSLTQT